MKPSKCEHIHQKNNTLWLGGFKGSQGAQKCQSRQSHWDRDPQGWKMKAIWNHHSPHAILRTGTYPSNFQGEPRVFALSKWQKPVGVSIVALNSLDTIRYFRTIFPHQPWRVKKKHEGNRIPKKKTCGFVLFFHGLDYLHKKWLELGN